MPVVVSNSSPLIALCRIDLLRVLKELWGEIMVPEAVYGETVVDGKGKHGADIIDSACQDWIKVVSV